MNRNLTLILLALVVFVLLGVWLYLLFLAPAQETNQEPVSGSGEFTDFQFGDTTDPNQSTTGYTRQDTEEDTFANPADPDILRQLTTRNTVGYVEIGDSVYFMESGVGHIYSIDLATNEETRVSATTIPDARQAAFANDSSFVVVKTGDSTGVNPIFLITVDEETNTASVPLIPISEVVSDFTVTSDGDILFAAVGNNAVSVQSYDRTTSESEVLFSVPFREAKVIFGDSMEGPHYFYPRTNTSLEGFVYQYDNGELARLPIDGFGLSSVAASGTVITTSRSNNDVTSSIYNIASSEETLINPVIPEKCSVYESSVYCAVRDSALRFDSIENWNKGIDVFSDNLSRVGEVQTQLINIALFTGRTVDVRNGSISATSGDWYFQNKIDGSLWVYELSRVDE